MANPGAFKQAFLDFARANKAKVDLDKSIGELALYDQQAVAGVTDIRFFVGEATPARTNLQNSFTRPDGEHMVIVAFRVLDGVNASVQETDWSTGASQASIKNGTMTVQANGVTYLQGMPLSEATDETTDETRGTIWLTEPIFWQAQTRLQVDVNFPAAPAVNTNLRLVAVGVGTLS